MIRTIEAEVMIRNDRLKHGLFWGVLYLSGIAHWGLFCLYGGNDFHFFDWLALFPFVDVWREAWQQHIFPFYATLYPHDAAPYGERFLAIPMMGLSPDLILPGLIGSSNFIVYRILLGYTFAFAGIYLWSRELNLAKLASAFLWMAFCFNGVLVPRIGTGQLPDFVGYSMIPLFFWSLYRLHKCGQNKYGTIKDILILALMMGLTLMFGSMHVMYHMLLITILSCLFFLKHWIRCFSSIAVTLLLTLYYWLPVGLFSEYVKNRSFLMYGGYGWFCPLNCGLPNIIQRPLDTLNHYWQALTWPYTAASDASWEYSLYISVLGLALVVIGLWANTLKMEAVSERSSFDARIFRSFLWIAGILFLFSYRNLIKHLYGVVTQFVGPIPVIDNLPARWAIHGSFLLILCASFGLSRLVNVPGQKFRSWGLSICLIILLALLWHHSWGWSFHQSRGAFVPEPGELRLEFVTKVIEKPGEFLYKRLIVGGAVFSAVAYLVSLALLYWASLKSRRSVVIH